ncbi:MAG: ribosome maturation factor RimM [Acidimicrobiales bacterium]
MALLEVGRITKPHGIRGEVIVELVTNRTERLTPGSEFNTSDRTLIVERSSAHQGRWIVAFAGVRDRTAAELLRNIVLLAEPIDDPSSLWVHELIGSEVIDAGGVSRGTVTSVIANPASDLLELDGGELVPLRFVVSHVDSRVVVDAPAGLFGEP